MMSTVSVIGVLEVVDDIKRGRRFGGTLRRSVESKRMNALLVGEVNRNQDQHPGRAARVASRKELV